MDFACSIPSTPKGAQTRFCVFWPFMIVPRITAANGSDSRRTRAVYQPIENFRFAFLAGSREALCMRPHGTKFPLGHSNRSVTPLQAWVYGAVEYSPARVWRLNEDILEALEKRRRSATNCKRAAVCSGLTHPGHTIEQLSALRWRRHAGSRWRGCCRARAGPPVRSASFVHLSAYALRRWNR